MAQRDYEEQPEAPDLGASVQLESAQHLAAPPPIEVFDPGSGPLDESGETVRGESLGSGGDWTGRGPDPALPRDAADRDPAAGIDANRDVGGAAAPASGRGDVGPDAGLP